MSINIIAIATLLECLNRDKGATVKEIKEATGLHRGTIATWLKALRDRTPSLIYIDNWKRYGVNVVAAYKYGQDVEDAARPVARTAAQCSRDRRELNHIKKGSGPPAARQVKANEKRAEAIKKIPRHPITKRLMTKASLEQ